MRSIIRLSAAGESWEVPVLFEDSNILVVDKPSGLAASPCGPERRDPTLLGLLQAGIAEGKPWARERGMGFLMSPERVDPDISGVFILAKDTLAFQKLADMVGSEKPYKDVITVVRGRPEQDQFTVESKIAPDPVRAERMRVDFKHGKRARTLFTLVQPFTEWSLIKCQPLTHRPHQIRVHLRSVGLTMAGDALYGGKPLLPSNLKSGYRLKPKQNERPLIGAPLHHVEASRFTHPVTGEPMTITAQWPKDLTVAVKYLRRYEVPSLGGTTA